MKTLLVAMGLCVAILAGCNNPSSVDRGNRLMALAAGETAQVKSPPQRLTRQLNIAELQATRWQKADASKTLAAARETIAAGEALSTGVSMAGYVSICQLGRGIGDTSVASSACGDALALLKKIEPVQKRVPYVRGLAYEIRQLRGSAAATAFIREAGPWCKGIDDPIDRREALVMFANDLFACQDYDGGLGMLRNDNDPAWRSDTLLAMAKTSFSEAETRTFDSGKATNSRGAEGNLKMSYRKSKYAQQFDLDYERNFQGRQEPARQQAE